MVSRALLLVPILCRQVCILVPYYLSIPVHESTQKYPKFQAGVLPAGGNCNRAGFGARSPAKNSVWPRFSFSGGFALCRAPCGSPKMDASHTGKILARGSRLYSTWQRLSPGWYSHFIPKKSTKVPAGGAGGPLWQLHREYDWI